MEKEPYPSETADRYIVRFPPGMRERIKQDAEKNNRSMNAEIIARLESSFQPTPQKLVIDEIADNVLKRISAAPKSISAKDRENFYSRYDEAKKDELIAKRRFAEFAIQFQKKLDNEE